MKTLFSVLVALSLCSVYAEEIIPSEDQIEQHKGTSSTKDGIRTQTQDAGSTRTIFSVYRIPFKEGSVSFTWKVEQEQTIPFLVDGKPNGKATHNLLIRFNGGHRGDDGIDRLGITTFDGSTNERKRFQADSFDHHAKPGQWHKTSITIKGNKVTVVINGKSFTATSEKLREGSNRFCIGNKIGSRHIKDLKLVKVN